jgi:hypothetical protein
MSWDATSLNNKIAKMLKGTAKDKQKILINYLFDAPLMIPSLNISGKPLNEGNWEIIKESETARIKIVKNSKGQEAVPVFTDAEHLQRWMPQGSYYQTLYGKSVFEICVINKLDGLVVNPGSNIKFEVLGEEIQSILDRN